jgi:Peptidase S24-like
MTASKSNAKSKTSYYYKLFRVTRHDGRVTTVSLDPVLIAKGCQFLGGLKPVAKLIRASALIYRDGDSRSCSGFVADELRRAVSGAMDSVALEPARASSLGPGARLGQASRTSPILRPQAARPTLRTSATRPLPTLTGLSPSKESGIDVTVPSSHQVAEVVGIPMAFAELHLARPGAVLAFPVESDELTAAGYLRGDLLLVQTGALAKPGCVVVARHLEASVARRLLMDADSTWWLAPVVQTGPRTRCDGFEEIIGPVVGLYRVSRP